MKIALWFNNKDSGSYRYQKQQADAWPSQLSNICNDAAVCALLWTLCAHHRAAALLSVSSLRYARINIMVYLPHLSRGANIMRLCWLRSRFSVTPLSQIYHRLVLNK